MILYHGSDNPNIKEFTLKKSRKKIDFGVGIYLTSNKRQAEAWAKRKKKGIVYVFDIDMKDISVFVDNYRFTIYNTSNFFASC